MVSLIFSYLSLIIWRKIHHTVCFLFDLPQFNLAQCVTYLARAPKSSEIAAAYGSVKMCITEHQGPMPGVPLHLRNVSPQVLQRMGITEGRDQSKPKAFLPEGLENVRFFPWNYRFRSPKLQQIDIGQNLVQPFSKFVLPCKVFKTMLMQPSEHYGKQTYEYFT